MLSYSALLIISALYATPTCTNPLPPSFLFTYSLSVSVIIIIIIIIISFMQGIYTYIPETNHVPREYSVSAILSLLFMVPISLVPALVIITRWFKYDRGLCGLFTHKSVPVIFEPPCITVESRQFEVNDTKGTPNYRKPKTIWVATI